ncbi:MAG: 30S ribosomal protein S12 methylthiotransferase RimO [Chloroflexota bacterium]
MTVRKNATRTVAVVSLGCPKNQVDAEMMAGLLAEGGYRLVSAQDEADAIIVNTCGFIDAAKEESIQAILAAAQYKQNRCRAVVITGCLGQRYKQELLDELPEVDAIIGTGEFPQICSLLDRALGGERLVAVGDPQPPTLDGLPRQLISSVATAYLKIADGCDNRCAYCKIPDIRGSFRSRPLASVVREAERLVRGGVRELVVVAQDTTRYGEDLGPVGNAPRLPDLLRALAGLPLLRWIRIMYMYPTRISDELLDLMASEPKICKYFDIPLQHVTNRMLKAMNRRGDRQSIYDLIDRIRTRVPDASLRTAFIVGFPGETARDFNELLNSLSDLAFDNAGVFTYSVEEGTPAATRPGQVSQRVKEQRFHRAMSRQQEIALSRRERWIGREIDILVEGRDEAGLAVGRGEMDAPEVDGAVHVQSEAVPGTFIRVLIERAEPYDLYGREVSPQ